MFWATEPGGIDQVGCICTAQGFEFGYVGVIWGLDLRYDPLLQDWVGDPSASHDGTVRRARISFLENVKHVYRVLLSRGLKGCFVYFMDSDTRRYVESRIERAYARPHTAAALRAAHRPKEEYQGLGKEGARVKEGMAALPEMVAYVDDLELVADLAAMLERQDYAEWRTAGHQRQLLKRSIARLFRAAGIPDDRTESLADQLMGLL
jgi:hypothetical protein